MANQGRTLAIVRYAGTALLCVVAAFGAAFLIRRAVDHGSPSPRGTVAADTHTASTDPTPATSGHTEDTVAVHHRTRALAAEFAPGLQRITRERPKPRHTKHQTVSRSSAPTDSTSTPTYTTSTPTYTPTTTESAPSTGSSGSGSGGAGSGTGTTSIGHSGKGSGTTTIG
jgi:hypothetical protein